MEANRLEIKEVNCAQNHVFSTVFFLLPPMMNCCFIQQKMQERFSPYTTGNVPAKLSCCARGIMQRYGIFVFDAKLVAMSLSAISFEQIFALKKGFY
jgi:hypothetical protein